MFLGMEEATFEDLAFGFRFLREVDEVDLRVCLSGASYAAAEKSERRMALKIRTGAKPFPKTYLQGFRISREMR
jgi:hypothetical protein